MAGALDAFLLLRVTAAGAWHLMVGSAAVLAVFWFDFPIAVEINTCSGSKVVRNPARSTLEASGGTVVFFLKLGETFLEPVPRRRPITKANKVAYVLREVRISVELHDVLRARQVGLGGRKAQGSE
ncbi:hypothetical protein, partial [Thermogutta sp.]|uniref:hypothetical protein n=1 Tax=Thermogutta sp. TaxID=1962930 RepID=UPI00321FB69B